MLKLIVLKQKKSKQYKRKRNYWPLAIPILVILFLVAVNLSKSNNSGNLIIRFPQITPTNSTQSNKNWWEYPTDIRPTAKSGDDLLVVVNKNYRLPDTYQPTDLVGAQSAGIRTVGEVKLRSILIEDLKNLKNAARDAGISLSVTSGYRSFSEQQWTFDYWVGYNGGDISAAERISARAGHSQHQLGTALDFSSSEVGDQAVNSGFAQTKAAKWLAENTWRYGFALSYPEGKEMETGYSFESWHYRYIGVNNAAAWKSSGRILDDWLTRGEPAQ